MARPKTKKELLVSAEEQYTKLWKIIDTMTPEQQTQAFTFDTEKEKEVHWKRDKNIRDVLIHLYEWHQLLLNWITANQKGEKKPFLKEPYNWKTYGDMNVEFWKKHQNTSYIDAKKLLQKSHQEIMEVIEKFPNEALFEKGYYSWTGGSTLGSYCISTTSSHYDWAIKKIKKHLHTIKA